VDLTTSTRSSDLTVPPDVAWSVLTSGGSGPHWYAGGPFTVRAVIDGAVGGERPVAPPDRALRTGDRAYFWEVTRAEPYVLDLVARVRAPGQVSFRSRLVASGSGTRLTQSVRFRPDGVLGATYLLADLPAREVLLRAAHRRACAELSR
jgi:hypothetical protein